MKAKILILGLLFSAGLLFSLPVFAYTYTRTPSGDTIFNPVYFFVSANSYEEMKNELCVFQGSGREFERWRVSLLHTGNQMIYSYWVASSTISQNFLIPLPLAVYDRVYYQCQTYDIGLLQKPFEYGFEVIEAPPPPVGGNIITMPAGFATSALAYAGQIFTDTSSLILIGIGLLIAFWVVNKILVLTNVLEKAKIRKSEDYFVKDKPEKFKKNDWL